jgi:ferric-dicitrate binding protein FerR (iron transport regulator)
LVVIEKNGFNGIVFMQQKIDFKELLEQYLAGKCTKEEEDLLARFFEQTADRGKDTGLSAAERERLFVAFRQSPRYVRHMPVANLKGRLRLLFPRLWQVAAIFLLVVASAWGIWRWKGMAKTETAYYKVVSTPRGKILQVMLPDSSVVLLNANSTLKYNTLFTVHRDVQLKGEARFKVKHDKEHPFTVLTPEGVQTRVLGTEFTVSSYASLPETKIMVLSGCVQVKKSQVLLGLLTHDKVFKYDRLTGSSTISVVKDAGKLAGWTEGQWKYDNMRLEDLQALLENYYGIMVINTAKGHKKIIAEANMNFTFRQQPQEIISIFCITANCHYRWRNNATVELY